MMDNFEQIFKLIEDIERGKIFEDKIFSYKTIKFSVKNLLLYTNKKDNIILTNDDYILYNSNTNININRTDFNPYKIFMSNGKLIEFLNRTRSTDLNIYFNFIKDNNYNLNNLNITEDNLKYIEKYEIEDYENIFKAPFDISYIFMRDNISKKNKINAFLKVNKNENLNILIYKINKNKIINLERVKEFLHNFCISCQSVIKNKYRITFNNNILPKCYLKICFPLKKRVKKIEESYTNIILNNNNLFKSIILRDDLIERINVKTIFNDLNIKNEDHLFNISTLLNKYYDKIDFIYIVDFIFQIVGNEHLTKNILKVFLAIMINILKSDFIDETIIYKINKIIYFIHENLDDSYISSHIEDLEKIYKKMVFKGKLLGIKIKIRNIKN